MEKVYKVLYSFLPHYKNLYNLSQLILGYLKI